MAWAEAAQEAIGFSKYGINAIFHEPLERTAALKLVRATQPLITHEFRRYVRIPIVTEVNVVLADGRRFSATSAEISSGGMSFKTIEDLIAQSNAGSFLCVIDPAAHLGKGCSNLAQTAKPLIWNAFRAQRRAAAENQKLGRVLSGVLNSESGCPVREQRTAISRQRGKPRLHTSVVNRL